MGLPSVKGKGSERSIPVCGARFLDKRHGGPAAKSSLIFNSAFWEREAEGSARVRVGGCGSVEGSILMIKTHR
jgi:hypothetical protein